MVQAKQIRPGVWEFKYPGVKVPVRVYATEKLFSKMEEGVFKQAANVAQLPGIQKASLVMPDGHYGYGFPIGGVAAFDLEEGIVSPGGVGYDINCLSGDTRILHEHGYALPLKEFEQTFENEYIKCMNFTKEVKDTEIELFLKSKPKEGVYKIKTGGGRELIATGDHPLYTPQGMVPLREVSDKIAIYPFLGVPYEKPGNDIIVSERDILKLPLRKNKKQSIDELKKRELLPLRYSNEKLPYLLKIIGFVLGDGVIYFTKNKGTVWFYGEPGDLEEIRRDMKRLGFNPSRVYSRTREHEISTEYDDVQFTRTEYSFKTTSSSFAALLVAMGVPSGTKVIQDYWVPEWLFRCTRWQKRLFLASLFGAELSTPSTVTRHGYNFYAPILSMNKKKVSLKSGRKFLDQLCELLKEFGVKSSMIRERKEIINKKGDKSYRLRLQISSKPRNLIKFWSTVGFEFNGKKRFLANVAVQYLQLKDNVIRERINADKQIKEMKKKGVNSSIIYEQFRSRYINKRFIERSLYEERKTPPRVPSNFPTFNRFLETIIQELGTTGMVWDEIVSKETINYDNYVYDFTVGDEHHNFIANNFVVSNCGVRLLTTNLMEKDVRPKLRELVDRLFTSVPSGVGRKGKLRISESELDQVALTGARWAVERGLGYEEDLKHIEENGCIKGANPQNVSKRAKDRGRPQLGTLGAGNHFLEVQKVDKIYDNKIAEKFGILSENQIVVMVHTGSRGFGHQIADEYIKVMLSAAHRYGIELPDKELACAPLNSTEARKYFSAMYCGVNYAFCNREIITYWVRESFKDVFKEDCELKLIYDVCHNIAKFEKHRIDGETKELCIHRKGATRAFPAGREEIPQTYREVGQPVIIPGDMGTASYVLIGTEKAMEETWGSTCFTGDTKILTDKGVLKLEEIFDRFRNNESFSVPSINDNTLEIEWKPVSNAIKRRSNIVEVAISQTGRSKLSKLRTTPDHNFITLNGGELMHESISTLIKNKRMVCLLDSLPTPVQIYVNPNLAYLVGALVSDGYIWYNKKHGGVTFTQKKVMKKLSFIEHVQKCFKDVFKTELRECKAKVGGGYIRGQFMEGTATDFRCYQKAPAVELLSITSNLPAWALSLSVEATMNFLSGVIDGDGTWNPTHNVIDIFTGDENVAISVMIACLKLGILPYISKQRGNCFIIQISEKRKSVMEHTRRVEGAVNKRKYGTKLFSARQLFKDWRNMRWPFLHKAKRNNLISDYIISQHIHKYPYTEKKIRRIINSPIRMHRVKKLRDCGVGDVFNITVDGNHNYVVLTDTFMPVLVKNCHGAGRVMSRHGAIRRFRGTDIQKKLEARGQVVRATHPKILAEEASEAYKDIDEVIKSVSLSNISKPIARVTPLGVAKG